MLPDHAVEFPVIKLLNRVLSDYPAARVRLQAHQGKLIAAQTGPIALRMRITAQGEMDLVGNGGTTGASPDADLSITVPLSLLPGLARRDAAAISQIAFSGDAELAATLSDIARNVEWNVEEDLSRVVGDIAAHRIVGGAQRVRAWQQEAGQRLTENVAEYLTEERRALITKRELDGLVRASETLRDDLARLDARVSRILTRT